MAPIRESLDQRGPGLPGVGTHRELLHFLGSCSVKVPYRHTLLGVLSVVLHPLASMLIYVVLLGILLQEV